MAAKLYTVFGGSGFIGRYVVQQLASAGHRVRVAVRHPDQALFLKPLGSVGQIEPIAADLKHEASIERAVAGADGVVNLVGILYQSGSQSFNALQAEGAKRVARAAAKAGVHHLVHMSAIGAGPKSESLYGRSKAEGERQVKEAFPKATIIRPSIVFGKEDQFFNRFASLAKLTPVMPVFQGQTKFQPVYVHDVAEAIVKTLCEDGYEKKTFELGGPRTYSFKDLLRYILKVTYRKRLLVDVPLPLAKMKAFFLGLLPRPMLTLDQLRMLMKDNVVAKGAKGFSDLGIEPTPVEAIIPRQLQRYRQFGRFTQKPASSESE
jgi:NADH dehydrogenase